MGLKAFDNLKETPKVNSNNLSSSSNLILGDAFELLKTIPDKSVDLILTDPPYIVTGGDGGSVNKSGQLRKSLDNGILNDDQLKNGYDIKGVGREFLRICKVPNIYVWCNKLQIPEYFDFYVKENKLKFDILSWHKTNAVPTYSNKYLTDTEYCLYFRGSGVCFPQNYEDAKTFWFEPINVKDKKLWDHPTIKPLAMIEKLVRNSSKGGDTVLDCFMGSGTTGVACKKLKRNFMGIEINEKYYNLAKERIEKEN